MQRMLFSLTVSLSLTSTIMRSVIENLIDIRLKHGISKHEVLQGMFHTIVTHLDISPSDAMKIIASGIQENKSLRDKVAETLRIVAKMNREEEMGDSAGRDYGVISSPSSLSKKAS
jgi:hypothetical protein